MQTVQEYINKHTKPGDLGDTVVHVELGHLLTWSETERRAAVIALRAAFILSEEQACQCLGVDSVGYRELEHSYLKGWFAALSKQGAS